MSEFIQFENEDGQSMEMTRGDFQQKIIPLYMEKYWDDNENLRQFAMELVRKEFPAEATKAAERLLELYGPIEPAMIFRSIVHIQMGEFKEAMALLHETIEKYPQAAPAYLNLARLYGQDGNEQMAGKLLQQTLLIDPNQESALDWLTGSFMEAGKKEELCAYLNELGKREDAWRPHFVLAHISLKDGDLLTAVNMFKETLAKVNGNEQMVMNVTGELGQAGYVYQLIQISEEYWKPSFERPFAGFNYINALIQTDQTEKAMEVLELLVEHTRAEYKETVQEYMDKLPRELFEKAEQQKKNAQEAEKDQGKSWWKKNRK
ncbi:tetratricopeptide repeat protein [Brevibacillus daliensis]|uniref:tetratricopeptide repeat protein n=1 Tax=Brevibacillus daliensis TaxID=2892995 RepID=UPI001E643FCB|nr:tetratricopeptide repeat protein [Brevibacillus daliensis]